ncbi:RsmD family RNA methyltransferase [Winogradskyella sp. A3E31]|uniref:RsmD family RNA methyltransferase n=1 Tax=Winogradskyella sp. A3E31 TaxID=3349637 RepID=UPI00398B5CE5
MRIISGEFKGRRITAPSKLPVRPTTDMAKEALFNILNNRYYFDELSVLDLFAGTGNISYEFASRGCEAITAVDVHYGCVKFISETSDTFKMPIETIKSDVFKYLEMTTESFDIIFADPPYDFPKEEFSKIPDLVFENNRLNENGLLIVEHSKHTDLSDLEFFSEQKNYGGNAFSFFNK